MLPSAESGPELQARWRVEGVAVEGLVVLARDTSLAAACGCCIKLYGEIEAATGRVKGRPTLEACRLHGAASVMLEALRPIAAACPNDPGTSDLYDEQPVSITLGDVRRVWRALATVGGKR